MGENTKIEWAHHTFNPWVGCTKVSFACDNCYAEGWAKRTGQGELWQGSRRRTAETNWRQPLKWNRQAEAEGVRYRVFCASLADVFDNQVPATWRSDLFELIEDTPNLDWLLLTKRPQNIAKMIWPKWDVGLPRNIWLGTTVENQQEADRRIPALLLAPASVRFLSCEPLLGPVNLTRIVSRQSIEPGVLINCLTGDWTSDFFPEGQSGPRIHQVIVGGESGPNARPMHPAWERSIRLQCAGASVAYLGKQWGEWVGATRAPGEYATTSAATGEKLYWPTNETARHHNFGAGAFAFRIGKKAAGRLFDGVEHNGFPEVPA